MSKLLVDVAYSLGVLAFKAGKKCIPDHDQKFTEVCLTDCQVGEGVPYLDSWLKGWHDGNLGLYDESKNL